MEFKELPHKVQEIAAQRLADKISYVSGFTEGEVKNEPAKDQARQVREAFIELYYPNATVTSITGVDGETLRAMLKVEGARKGLITPLYQVDPGCAGESLAHDHKDLHHRPSSDLQDEDSMIQAVRGLCFFVLHLTQKEEQ